MRKLIISVALASTAAMAAPAGPAAAQYQNPYGGGYQSRGYEDQGYGGRGDNRYGYQQGQQIQQRIYQLRERIQRVIRRGMVSRGDVFRLQRELDQIERRYDQFARNGLDQREQYDLQVRIQRLQERVGDGRRDARGYNDDRRYNGDDRRFDDRRYNDDDRRDRDDRDRDYR